MYYLNEPIQLLNSLKFECKVQVISMPKKAKPFEFSVCKQSDLHPDLTESKLIKHKFVCTSYEAVAETLRVILLNDKLTFLYKDKRFIIQNSATKEMEFSAFSADFIKLLGFLQIYREQYEEVAHERTLKVELQEKMSFCDGELRGKQKELKTIFDTNIEAGIDDDKKPVNLQQMIDL